MVAGSLNGGFIRRLIQGGIIQAGPPPNRKFPTKVSMRKSYIHGGFSMAILIIRTSAPNMWTSIASFDQQKC